MYLMDLPYDLLYYIESILSIEDLISWKTTVKSVSVWKSNHIFKNGYTKLMNSFQKIKIRNTCVQCTHACITQAEWSDGRKISFLPWCTIHINPLILQGIELYCLSGPQINDIHNNYLLRI